MSLLSSLSPDINDDDYVLLQKWAYQLAQQAGNAANQPVFGDNDHTLIYKIADSSYEMAPA
jgi:hypothetical protein